MHTFQRAKQVVQVDVAHRGLLQVVHLAEVLDEVRHARCGLMNGTYTLLVGASLDGGIGEVGLRYAADGRCGIHDFMRQYARQALP